MLLGLFLRFMLVAMLLFASSAAQTAITPENTRSSPAASLEELDEAGGLQAGRSFNGIILEGYSYDFRHRRPLFARVLAEDYSLRGNYAIVFRGTSACLANTIDEVNRFVIAHSEAVAAIILAPPLQNGDHNLEFFHSGRSDNVRGITFTDAEACLVESRVIAEILQGARDRHLRRENDLSAEGSS